MLAVGGLKAAAKRTVFGDISNTAKPTAYDDSAVDSKGISMDIVKSVAVQEKSAAFLRPAQRPLNVAAAKGAMNHNSIAQSDSIFQPMKGALAEPRQQQPTNKRALSKRGTTIYKDTADNEQQMPALKQDSAPIAPVHQHLGPRHIKSQPQLKPEPPVLRRTQSKYIGTELSEDTIPNDPAYQEEAETQIANPLIEPYESYSTSAEEKYDAAMRGGVKLSHEVDRQHRQLPNPLLVSEPEEYWEEEEDEVYDDQGYTTAHSFRSRGDNTTGGATTVLFPKVTNKAKKELAAAKELVESARSAEDIEDELWDTSMVAEYGDEIFAYMRELEVSWHTPIQLLCFMILNRVDACLNGRPCGLH